MLERLNPFVARALERGRFDGTIARAASRAYAVVARPDRPIALPRGAASIGIGGATLGGSGKTALAMAIADALARKGFAPAIVSNGHGARLTTTAAVVRRNARPDEVGDEAALVRQALSDEVLVVVGSSRSDSASLARAEGANVLVVDGTLQARPVRFDVSLLAVSALAPFGSGRCPPSGDLRASPDALARAADFVAVEELPGVEARSLPYELASHGQFENMRSATHAVKVDSGEVRPLSSFRGTSVGLVTRLAHPERVGRLLAAAGIDVAEELRGGDHLPFAPRLGLLDAYLTTKKCALRLEATPRDRLWVIEDRLILDTDLVACVEHRVRERLESAV